MAMALLRSSRKFHNELLITYHFFIVLLYSNEARKKVTSNFVIGGGILNFKVLLKL